MQSRVDAEFVAETERYHFRFTCEACAHFDVARRACGEGYPTDPHRRIELRRVEHLEFCKSFELR